MYEYNPRSLRAEEFISDAEIRETLAYAEANKDNLALIDEILEKARPVKTGTGYSCKGLSHREASVLLACEDPELNRKMFALADGAIVGSAIIKILKKYGENSAPYVGEFVKEFCR